MALEGLWKTPSYVFWTQKENGLDVSDSSDAYVPGVSDVGNKRPHRINQWKTREARAKGQGSEVRSQVKASRSGIIDLKPFKKNMKKHASVTSEDTEETGNCHARRPSLKDLCSEDKQRVANLIKELAKIGEEKEKAVEQMHLERVNFEKEILQLLEQQESILKERQTIHTELVVSQQALSVYQQKLEGQQQQQEDPAPDTAHQEKKDVKSTNGCKSRISYRHRQQSSSSGSLDEGSDDQLQVSRTYQRRQEKRKEDNRIGTEAKGSNSGMPKPHHSGDNPDRLQMNGTERQPNVNPRQDEERHDTDDVREPKDKRPTQLSDRLSNNFRNLDLDVASQCENDIFRTPQLSKARTKKPRNHGPLPEPIMSSTQKSSEIYAEMSFRSRSSVDNYYPLQTDTSLTTKDNLANSFPGRYSTSKHNHGNRVNFVAEDQYSDDGPFHSPSLARKSSNNFADPNFVAYYRKLGPKERKQELLSQRKALLGEQNKLRTILQEQEDMLKVKREQLHKQQMIQAQRLAHFEETGVFPLADTVRQQCNVLLEEVDQNDMLQAERLAPFENRNGFRLNNVYNMNIHDELLGVGGNIAPDDGRVGLSPRSENRVQFQTEIRGGNLSTMPAEIPCKVLPTPVKDPLNSHGNLVSTATSPIQFSPDRKVSMATTPMEKGILSPQQPAMSPRQAVVSPRDHADAATSYTRSSSGSADRAILSSPGSHSKQGNLPLATNRQKSALKSCLNTSGDKKGFSVLEILDKLESEADTSLASNSSALRNGSLNSKGHNSIVSSDSYVRSRMEVSDEESLAELEESKVLEDVFFLK